MSSRMDGIEVPEGTRDGELELETRGSIKLEGGITSRLLETGSEVREKEAKGERTEAVSELGGAWL